VYLPSYLCTYLLEGRYKPFTNLLEIKNQTQTEKNWRKYEDGEMLKNNIKKKQKIVQNFKKRNIIVQCILTMSKFHT
jgi:hypothetical protein